MIAALVAVALTQAPSPSPSPSAPPSGPVVLLQTSLGDVKVRLDRDKAPITVDNFLGYVKSRHYDGTIFHRVIPDFMAQGGGMDAAMKPRPRKPPIKNEGGNGLRNLRGTIAMARTNDPDSATDQFFINVKDNAFLDRGPRNPAGYAVFGEVIEGMDVVDKMVAVPKTTKGSHENVPQTPIVIKKALLLTPMPSPRPAPRAGAARTRPRPRPSASPRP